jgi:serine/threonine-protein kinase HipA
VKDGDDHLRNHGFLRGRAGWRLAPAFDVNPNPDLAARRVTSIAGADNPADDLRALVMYAPSFGLTDAQARTTLREVADAAAGWEVRARGNGVTAAEIERFRPTLSHTIEATIQASRVDA